MIFVSTFFLSKILNGFNFNGPNINFARYDEVDTSVAKATLAGWGNDGEDVTAGPSNELRKATISLNANCSNYALTNYYSPGQMICAGDEG